MNETKKMEDVDAVGITENAARHENFCRGCGGHKESDIGLPVVCWPCWKGDSLPFTPYKYFGGTFTEWLSEVKAKTGKVFNGREVFNENQE